eukprot:gene7563-9009_t
MDLEAPQLLLAVLLLSVFAGLCSGELLADQREYRECAANVGRCFALDMPSRGLTGPLPTEVGSFTHLEHLRLRNNSLTGLIPVELAGLTSLTLLDLSTNSLNSTLPAPLGSLTALRVFYASDNPLIGSLPSELGLLARLHALSLNCSYRHKVSPGLTGTIPTELGLLADLTALDLSLNGLSGGLPSELGRLAALSALHLSGNVLRGPVPTMLGALHELRLLDLAHNCLTGNIPSHLGRLAWLERLVLHSTLLTGPVPSELGRLNATLEELLLANNSLTGENPDGRANLSRVLEELMHADVLGASQLLAARSDSFHRAVPTELGQLTELRRLELFVNSLSGTFPSEMLQLGSLEELALLGNPALEWPLTSEVGRLTRLRSLALSHVAIGTALPSDLGRLRELTRFFLSSAKLTGTLPTELGLLTSLGALWLGNNTLSGRIPTELGNLTHLQQMWLQTNRLEGSIPSEWGQLTRLASVGLHDNSLGGTIPVEMCNLARVQVVALQSNQFSGTIPELGYCFPKLAQLDLGGNQFSGSIPSSVCAVEALHRLSFSNNAELTGTIPECLGRLSTTDASGDSSIFIEGTKLSGSIPRALCNLTLTQLYLNGNDLTGTVPPCLFQQGHLRNLSLAYNRLKGTLPGATSSNLTTLNLRNNHFSGTIPEALARLVPILTNLHLDHNHFSCHLPREILDWKPHEEPQASVSVLSGNHFNCKGLHEAYTQQEHLFKLDPEGTTWTCGTCSYWLPFVLLATCLLLLALTLWAEHAFGHKVSIETLAWWHWPVVCRPRLLALSTAASALTATWLLTAAMCFLSVIILLPYYITLDSPYSCQYMEKFTMALKQTITLRANAPVWAARSLLAAPVWAVASLGILMLLCLPRCMCCAALRAQHKQLEPLGVLIQSGVDDVEAEESDANAEGEEEEEEEEEENAASSGEADHVRGNRCEEGSEGLEGSSLREPFLSTPPPKQAACAERRWMASPLLKPESRWESVERRACALLIGLCIFLLCVIPNAIYVYLQTPEGHHLAGRAPKYVIQYSATILSLGKATLMLTIIPEMTSVLAAKIARTSGSSQRREVAKYSQTIITMVNAINIVLVPIIVVFLIDSRCFQQNLYPPAREVRTSTAAPRLNPFCPTDFRLNVSFDTSCCDSEVSDLLLFTECMRWSHQPAGFKYYYNVHVAFDAEQCVSAIVTMYIPVMMQILVLQGLLWPTIVFLIPLLVASPPAVVMRMFNVARLKGVPLDTWQAANLPVAGEHSSSQHRMASIEMPSGPRTSVGGSCYRPCCESMALLQKAVVILECSVCGPQDMSGAVEPRVTASCLVATQAEEQEAEGAAIICASGPAAGNARPSEVNGRGDEVVLNDVAKIMYDGHQQMLSVLMITLTYGLIAPVVAGLACMASAVLLFKTVHHLGRLHHILDPHIALTEVYAFRSHKCTRIVIISTLVFWGPYAATLVLL